MLDIRTCSQCGRTNYTNFVGNFYFRTVNTALSVSKQPNLQQIPVNVRTRHVSISSINYPMIYNHSFGMSEWVTVCTRYIDTFLNLDTTTPNEYWRQMVTFPTLRTSDVAFAIFRSRTLRLVRLSVLKTASGCDLPVAAPFLQPNGPTIPTGHKARWAQQQSRRDANGIRRIT